ncbi:hypothetical protein [Streptomyces sp. NPDC006510]|uniref:hypothetical protein n=1 Tax=Streptomyces sp. NPDC006510 TaxID=3155600 RepID=UPI0033A75ACC
MSAAAREAPPLEVPARHRHQLPEDVRGLAVGVLLGHDGEVVGQQQRTELTDQPRQLGAVGVELRQRGLLLLAALLLPDQLHVVGGPQDLLRGELGHPG